ncbi:hypothetical protein JXA85_04095 [Candidatus Woesearchaeota archaeon]|nr:hypothetical protein [Candidatus Woesearchaeota archaeon]
MAAKSRKEVLNRELDEYLDSITRENKRDDFSNLRLKVRKEKAGQLEREPVIDEKLSKPLFQQLIDFANWRRKKEKMESAKKVEERFEEEMEQLDEKEEELIEEEAEIKQKKKNLLSRFIRALGFGSDEEEVTEEDYEQEVEVEKSEHEKYNEILNDMKLLGKLSVGMLKMVPKKDLQRYKESEDFEVFKEILKKYNLIK